MSGSGFGVKRPSLSTWWLRPGGHHADLVARGDDAVHDAHQRDDAHVVVEPGIDDQRLQRRLRVALGRRDALHERLEQLGYALAGLGADPRRIGGIDADDLLDLLADLVGIGRGQIDLVDDRHDLEPLVDRRVAVGDALGLDALGGIHHQQRAVAGREGARHLVGEVHVPGRVDHVELVALAVLSVVVERDALRLDGDAALALEVHGVEHLGLHLARLRGLRRAG